MYDFLLTGGLVIDGSGEKPYIANVCIKDGKIACITTEDAKAKQVMDVSGLAVTPGFIDIHTHSDCSHMRDYPVESQVFQGVTTEIAGNCGTSVMPTTPARQEEMDREIGAKKNFRLFASVSDYAKYGNHKGACMHYGTLIGHSTLRMAVMGFVNRDPDEAELQQLKDLLEQELQRGAFGMSLGLIYPPSAFSKPYEIIELAKVIAKYDGILAVHMRNEGPKIFEAVEEMLDIARKSGVHLHISHLKLMGKPQWGKHPQLIKVITDAQAEGLNVTCDQYPFPASSTNLSALVPHWAHEGGTAELTKRVETREGTICQEILQEMTNRGGPEAVMIASTHGAMPEWEGKTIKELSDVFQLDAVETVRKVLLTCKGRASCVYFSMSTEDMKGIMQQMFISVGSDGASVSYDKNIVTYVPHPRYYSAFSRFFQVVREENLMPLEKAVQKVTSLPASILGIHDRGILKEGMVADIAVFDPKTFASRSDFLESRVRPVGMHHVIVKGVPVILNGTATGALPGGVLLKATGNK